MNFRSTTIFIPCYMKTRFLKSRHYSKLIYIWMRKTGIAHKRILTRKDKFIILNGVYFFLKNLKLNNSSLCFYMTPNEIGLNCVAKKSHIILLFSCWKFRSHEFFSASSWQQKFFPGNKQSCWQDMQTTCTLANSSVLK